MLSFSSIYFNVDSVYFINNINVSNNKVALQKKIVPLFSSSHSDIVLVQSSNVAKFINCEINFDSALSNSIEDKCHCPAQFSQSAVKIILLHFYVYSAFSIFLQ